MLGNVAVKKGMVMAQWTSSSFARDCPHHSVDLDGE
jgi:hypothetical protein